MFVRYRSLLIGSPSLTIYSISNTLTRKSFCITIRTPSRPSVIMLFAKPVLLQVGWDTRMSYESSLMMVHTPVNEVTTSILLVFETTHDIRGETRVLRVLLDFDLISRCIVL